MSRRGSILVGLLWCVALLALVVVSVLHTATMDLRVAQNYSDRIQARCLALAGVEKAKALLYLHTQNRGRNGPSLDDSLFNAPLQFRDVRLGRGEFRVFRPAAADEPGGVWFGVSDEESRLNVNSATPEQLVKIDGLNSTIAADILAWRGQSGPQNSGGASVDYYNAMIPPRFPRSANIQTIRELLMVRGIDARQLFGQDQHQTGLREIDSGELDDSGASARLSSNVDGGWATLLTVDSRDDNVDAAGKDRVDIQTADEASLSLVNGITPAIARSIVQYRNQRRFTSIADLLDVTPATPNAPGRNAAPNGAFANDPAAANANSGPSVIDETLLISIADQLTVGSEKLRMGLIDVNTASVDVLACLPGVDRELAQAIHSYARSQGYFANVAGLLKVPGLSRDILKEIAPLTTARSETFRILSEGRVPGTGTRQRVQVIVHVGMDRLTTLSYREDNL